jgi:flagellar biosynthesis chaperone FliJ
VAKVDNILTAAHAEITKVKADTAVKADDILMESRAKIKAVRDDAAKKVANIDALIAKYEAALETTTKAIKDAYHQKLGAEAQLAEMARQSAQEDAKATRELLDKLGTSAEKVAPLKDAVDSLQATTQTQQQNIQTLTEQLNQVPSDFIRTIAHATGNGPNDNTDNGQIASRVLSFTKAKTNTQIRISYTDNWRTYGTGKGCRWEIRVDGRSCPNQALVYDDYAYKDDNTFSSRKVIGYCSGIAAGSHTIGIWVGNVPGGHSAGDCYTGWNTSTWVLEAEEVN